MNRLTAQQQAVYDFIRECMISRGYGPTVREIGEFMNISSPNGVMCHLRAIEKKGYIHRVANKSRAIELTEPLHPGHHGLQTRACCTLGVIHERKDSKATGSENPLGMNGSYLIEVSDGHLTPLGIERGDQMIVHRGGRAANGRIVMFQSTEGKEMHLGRCLWNGSEFYFHPLDESQSPELLDEHRIVGCVMGIVRMFPNGPQP